MVTMVTTETYKNESEILPANDVYTRICATYPFSNTAEENNFHEKVSKINTEDTVEQIKLLLEALDNPHTSFYKKPDESNRIRQDGMPSAEIIDEILIMHIPVLNIERDQLTNLFDKYAGRSKGLIIDLQDCRGGAEGTARELEIRLVPKGAYEFGTNIIMKPEGGIESRSCIFTSDNEHPYEKPIVVLTNNKTFSSAERFLTSLRASTKITVIGTETCGGSANPVESEVDINGVTYIIKIPTWKFIPKGETQAIEETKIKPDIFYDKTDIVEFTIKHIIDLRERESVNNSSSRIVADSLS